MANDHYMPWFYGDFMASTGTWIGAERGLYIQLLGLQWASGPLPSDINRLAMALNYEIGEFKRLWPTVGEKFELEGAVLINARLEEHRRRSADLAEKRRGSGRAGGDAKWGETTQTPSKTRGERLANARRLATHSKEQWEALVEVCENKCVRCGIPSSELHGQALCKDHVVPIYQGGSDGIENIQPMCRNCNSSKGPECKDFRPNGWQNALGRSAIQSNPVQSTLDQTKETKSAEIPGATAAPESSPPEPGDLTDAVRETKPKTSKARKAPSFEFERADYPSVNWAAFESFVEHRKELGKAIRPKGAKYIVELLARFTADQQAQMVKASQVGGYSGLYEPRGGGNGSGPKPAVRVRSVAELEAEEAAGPSDDKQREDDKQTDEARHG